MAYVLTTGCTNATPLTFKPGLADTGEGTAKPSLNGSVVAATGPKTLTLPPLKVRHFLCNEIADGYVPEA